MNLSVVYISDSLSAMHSSKFTNALGKFYDDEYGKPLFISYKNILDTGLIPLSVLPNDLISKEGIIKARKSFVKALRKYYKIFDIDIVLLAASTKRIFGKEAELSINEYGEYIRNGSKIKEIYQDLIFTNGDNGTAIILNKEIDNLINNFQINKKSNAVIINGLGFLGTDALNHIIKNYDNMKIFVISKHSRDINKLINNNIEVFESIFEIPEDEAKCIKAIINCTHHPNSIINENKINYIQNSESIYVIDVAVPYGFPEKEYEKCNNVFRQDGGNAFFSEGLEFYFDPQIAGLTDNIVYGCFAEAICLGLYLKEYPENKDVLKQYDWFNVNEETKSFVSKLFDKYGVGIPPKPINYMTKLIDI